MTARARGFASMDAQTLRLVASKGGKTAHERGKAHEWSVEEARAAGQKGAINSARVRRDRAEQRQLQKASSE